MDQKKLHILSLLAALTAAASSSDKNRRTPSMVLSVSARGAAYSMPPLWMPERRRFSHIFRAFVHITERKAFLT